MSRKVRSKEKTEVEIQLMGSKFKSLTIMEQEIKLKIDRLTFQLTAISTKKSTLNRRAQELKELLKGL
jgi:hypothetical protein